MRCVELGEGERRRVPHFFLLGCTSVIPLCWVSCSCFRGVHIHLRNSFLPSIHYVALLRFWKESWCPTSSLLGAVSLRTDLRFLEAAHDFLLVPRDSGMRISTISYLEEAYRVHYAGRITTPSFAIFDHEEVRDSQKTLGR